MTPPSCLPSRQADTPEPERLRWLKNESEQILLFGTFEYDIQSGEAVWSDGVYRLLDYESVYPVMDCRRLSEHIVAENGEEAMQILKQTLEGSEDYCVEHDVITAKGRKKHVQLTGRIIPDKAGKPILNIGILRDITAKYLHQQSLKNAIDELKRSNSELEEFAYVASHDLQEPLRKITIFTDRLYARYTSTLDQEAELYMERIVAAAASMRGLIDNLLEFSRISRSDKAFVTTNLNHLLQKISEDLDLVIEETGAAIVSQPLPTVSVIPSQVQQLFNNIVGNAIKFRNPDKPPVIHVTTSALSAEACQELHLPEDRVYHRIEFRDNGIGFDDEYALSIFHIFQRLHGKSEYPGSGIGLAICKKIMDQHNGLIFASGMPGNGAVFTIILPEEQV